MFNRELVMNLNIVLLSFLSSGAVYCYFDVELTEGRSVKGTGEISFDGVKVKKINRTIYAGIGTIEATDEINDNFEVTESFYKKQGNEYRLTPFHVGPYKFCDYIQNQSLFYDGFLNCSSLPPKQACPWTKETFNINQCLFPMDQIPKYFNGEYRIDIIFSKNGEVSGRFQAFFYVLKDDS